MYEHTPHNLIRIKGSREIIYQILWKHLADVMVINVDVDSRDRPPLMPFLNLIMVLQFYGVKRRKTILNLRGSNRNDLVYEIYSLRISC